MLFAIFSQIQSDSVSDKNTENLHISVHPNQQYPYLECVGAGWVGLCGAAVARVGSVRGGAS